MRRFILELLFEIFLELPIVALLDVLCFHQKHLSQIVYQAESAVGVTKTFGAKCGNASYLMGFFQGKDMHVPYILSSKGRDVVILNGASYKACMGMAQIARAAGVRDAICIN